MTLEFDPAGPSIDPLVREVHITGRANGRVDRNHSVPAADAPPGNVRYRAKGRKVTRSLPWPAPRFLWLLLGLLHARVFNEVPQRLWHHLRDVPDPGGVRVTTLLGTVCRTLLSGVGRQRRVEGPRT